MHTEHAHDTETYKLQQESSISNNSTDLPFIKLNNHCSIDAVRTQGCRKYKVYSNYYCISQVMVIVSLYVLYFKYYPIACDGMTFQV